MLYQRSGLLAILLLTLYDMEKERPGGFTLNELEATTGVEAPRLFSGVESALARGFLVDTTHPGRPTSWRISNLGRTFVFNLLRTLDRIQYGALARPMLIRGSETYYDIVIAFHPSHGAYAAKLLAALAPHGMRVFSLEIDHDEGQAAEFLGRLATSARLMVLFISATQPSQLKLAQDIGTIAKRGRGRVMVTDYGPPDLDGLPCFDLRKCNPDGFAETILSGLKSTRLNH